MIVFTDLDGTLLDHHSYDFTPALPALERLRAGRVPVVLTTSKTLEETRHYACELGLDGPLITENGGAVCTPLAVDADQPKDLTMSGYGISVSGPGYGALKAWLHRLRTTHDFRFTGFSDWTVEQVAQHTGLDQTAAGRARQRLATEPLVWEDSEQAWTRFQREAAAAGLRCVEGGRFRHLIGPREKSEAMRQVLERFPTAGGPIIALGDGPNDREMLLQADIAVVIRNHNGGYLDLPERPDAIRTRAAGPQGWLEAMDCILEDHPV